ncbi:MAG: radical SAM family heme chaperone HemW [Gammaproteobacteria bacterium]
MSSKAGLYIHIPYCSAVCPYCDFAVRVGSSTERTKFPDKLIAELALINDWAYPIDTIYFGGGTPSILSASALAQVLDAASKRLPVEPDARIHLEANPEDVTPQRLKAWRAIGVEFLSLGIQSFDDKELAWLGRRHDGEHARTVLAEALQAGFHTVSADLIFGLPAQTLASLERNTDTLETLTPQHASLYQLTIHEGTTFGGLAERGKLTELDNSPQAELFRFAHEGLGALGLNAYEVSNFACNEAHRSSHNQKYWAHVPYLGIGPSAHSFDGKNRWWNERTVTAYGRALEKNLRPVQECEQLSKEDVALEMLMLRLRTVDGLNLGEFTDKTDVDLVETNRTTISMLVEEGYLVHQNDLLAPTLKGLAVADWIVGKLELG